MELWSGESPTCFFLFCFSIARSFSGLFRPHRISTARPRIHRMIIPVNLISVVCAGLIGRFEKAPWFFEWIQCFTNKIVIMWFQWQPSVSCQSKVNRVTPYCRRSARNNCSDREGSWVGVGVGSSVWWGEKICWSSIMTCWETWHNRACSSAVGGGG